jgi:hypothetical protein
MLEKEGVMGLGWIKMAYDELNNSNLNTDYQKISGSIKAGNLLTS